MRSAFGAWAAFPARRWSAVAVVLALVLTGLYAPAGHAAEFTVTTRPLAAANPTAVTPIPTVRMTGMIEPGDAEKLRQILDKIAASSGAKPDAPLTTIELSSMGGNLNEGFRLGLLFRKYRMIAVVRKRDFCMSSCALAFLGGNAHRSSDQQSDYPAECNLEIGGEVAFHNFWLNRAGLRSVTSEDPVASRLQGFDDARGGAALLIKYAGDMGLPPNFVASLMGRPVEDFQYIETVGQFLSFHVCPIGLSRPSIPLDAQAINVCRNSIGDSDPPPQLQALPIAEPKVKQYLLERVQENMRASRAKGRLAAQLANGAVMRVKEEIDRLYDDLRAAGVALPDIVGPTFEIGAKRSEGYEPVCYVSLSPDKPDRFDVVVQGPRGLTDPPRLPPEDARRLFLYDRNDVVNPRPH